MSARRAAERKEPALEKATKLRGERQRLYTTDYPELALAARQLDRLEITSTQQAERAMRTELREAVADGRKDLSVARPDKSRKGPPPARSSAAVGKPEPPSALLPLSESDAPHDSETSGGQDTESPSPAPSPTEAPRSTERRRGRADGKAVAASPLWSGRSVAREAPRSPTPTTAATRTSLWRSPAHSRLWTAPAPQRRTVSPRSPHNKQQCSIDFPTRPHPGPASRFNGRPPTSTTVGSPRALHSAQRLRRTRRAGAEPCRASRAAAAPG